MGLAETSTRRSHARSGQHARLASRTQKRTRTSAPRTAVSTRAPVAHDEARIDEARRPHDGATRNGVATLSSGGAGREETWRGADTVRAAGNRTVKQQRLRRVADYRRYSPGRPFSRYAFRSRPLSRLLETLRDEPEPEPERERERAHALLAPFAVLAPTPSYRHLLSSPFLFLSFISFRLLLCCFPRRY